MAKKISISTILTIIITAISYYFVLPPLNFFSPLFWGFIGGILVVFFMCYLLTASVVNSKKYLGTKTNPLIASDDRLLTVVLAILGILLVVFLIGGLIGTPLFSSGKYASTLKVEESTFEKEIIESTQITDIALMDSDSAAILGNRTMGSLTELVSQFEVSETYSQIDYNGSPAKVAPLEYAGLFKCNHYYKLSCK